jgi:hypothetical protein
MRDLIEREEIARAMAVRKANAQTASDWAAIESDFSGFNPRPKKPPVSEARTKDEGEVKHG